jgi:membrane-associated protease RseP (regulator of RpoE activity)
MKSLILICALFIALVSWGAGAWAVENEPGQKVKKSGWIGAVVQDVDKKIAKKESLKNNQGAYIADVLDDSPADSAGLIRGDVVIRFAEKAIENADELLKAVRKTEPGTRVSVLVLRKGEEKNFSLKIGSYRMKREFGIGGRQMLPNMPFMFNARILGLRLLPLNEQLGEYFGAPQDEGMLVQDVAKRSSAAEAGLKAGDIILQAGKRTVHELNDILREVRKYDEGDTLRLTVLRRGEKLDIPVIVQESDAGFDNFQFTVPRMQFHGFFGDGEELMNSFLDNFNGHVEVSSSQDEDTDSVSGDMNVPF